MGGNARFNREDVKTIAYFLIGIFGSAFGSAIVFILIGLQVWMSLAIVAILFVVIMLILFRKSAYELYTAWKSWRNWRVASRMIMPGIYRAIESLADLIERREGAFFQIIDQFPYEQSQRKDIVSGIRIDYNDLRLCYENRLRAIKDRYLRMQQNPRNYHLCFESEIRNIIEELVRLHNDFEDWRKVIIKSLSESNTPFQQAISDRYDSYKSKEKKAIASIRDLLHDFNRNASEKKFASLNAEVVENDLGTFVWNVLMEDNERKVIQNGTLLLGANNPLSPHQNFMHVSLSVYREHLHISLKSDEPFDAYFRETHLEDFKKIHDDNIYTFPQAKKVDKDFIMKYKGKYWLLLRNVDKLKVCNVEFLIWEEGNRLEVTKPSDLEKDV